MLSAGDGESQSVFRAAAVLLLFCPDSQADSSRAEYRFLQYVVCNTMLHGEKKELRCGLLR